MLPHVADVVIGTTVFFGANVLFGAENFFILFGC